MRVLFYDEVLPTVLQLSRCAADVAADVGCCKVHGASKFTQ
jgi:hypothetical protein